jgi:predicted  nucleic acid-binding Zn-ribbon protein
MAADTAAPATSGKSSFLREGWRELRRKLERRTLRNTMAQQDRAQNAALAALGQKAWESGMDLSDFAELRDQLKGLEARTGELTSVTNRLESEKTALEEQRRSEVARFDAQRKDLEEKKRPVDAALRDLNQKRSALEREIRSQETRLAAIAGELAALEKQAASAVPSGQASSAAPDARRQQLLTEQSQLSVAHPKASEAMQALGPELQRLNEEAQGLANELTRVEAERRAVLGQLDASLDRLRAELRATGQQSAAAGEERQNRFLQLGRKVYGTKKSEPAFAAEVGEVQKAEAALAASAGALRASVAETQAMPRGTLAKFFATIVLVPLLLVGLVYGVLLGWEYWGPEKRVETPKPVNPYLSHSLSAHPAYALADKLAAAGSEQEVAQLLREALGKIHVGIYADDGRQILAGAERSENDFFLYESQWKILARAFHLRNGMSFRGHTQMLGRALLELEEPAELESALGLAIKRRYDEARQKPDDPMNFLILFADGLARQQVAPYSLGEAHRFSHERTLVDPAQSFLVMLDFFTRPPAPEPATSFRWLPSFVPTVYAQSPCDAIKGDQGQGHWGRGTSILTDILGQLPGAAGKVAGAIGNATGIMGAIGDLLILYGMTIELKPQPSVIHLLHGEDAVAGIQATVRFDSQGVPDSVLKCGWLAGKQMPPNGALKDVELTWDFHPVLPPYLEMHREMMSFLTGHAGGLRTTTDENGSSVFLMQPKPCPDRRGWILGRDYMASVNARYVTKSIPTPGLLGFGLILKLGPGAIEYLMRGRSGYARFRAEWHKRKPDERPY